MGYNVYVIQCVCDTMLSDDGSLRNQPNVTFFVK